MLPLDGIRVLEVDNWGFAPSAGCVLADWGADVIKIEPPGRGDPLRGIFGVVAFGDGGMENFMHEQWNRNKRSLALDLASAEGRAILDELLPEADVFLTNYLPDIRERLNLTTDDVRKANSSIIYALATGQGSKGPDAARPSFDYVSAWARAGVGGRLTPEGAPFIAQRAGFVDTTGGNFLAGAVAAALVQRERTGEGTDVEVSLLATGGWMLGPDIANYLINGFELPLADAQGKGAGPLMSWYECADGKRLVFTMMDPERYWPSVAAALGRDDVLTDERFDTPEKRGEQGEALMDVLRGIIASEPREHWAPRFQDADLVWAPVQSPAEYVEDVQVLENGYVVEVDRGDKGTMRLVSSPAQFGGEPIPGRFPAPDLGQDSDAVLGELGWDDERIAAARESGTIN